MFSPISKSARKSNNLNQSFNKSFNTSLSVSRSQRRRTAVFPLNNQSFFGTNNSKNNNALNASTLANTEESCFQIVDFKGHVPTSIINAVMDSDACTNLRLHESGVALLSTLECIYVWHFVCKKKCYELPLLHLSSSLSSPSSPFDATSPTSFIQAALSIPDVHDDNDLDMDSISCVAVTTNGLVFYWKSIAYSRSFAELSISSEFGESDVCVDVVAVGEAFVVGWMSGALTHLLPYQHTLKASALRHQTGARLSTIGRRVSSLFFGSSPDATAAGTSGSLRKLLAAEGEEGEWRLVVMGESSLQLWSLHKMHYTLNLVEMLKTHMRMQGLPQEAYSDLSLQDIQLTGSSSHRTSDRLTVLATTNDKQAVTHHIVFLESVGGTPIIQKLVNTAFTTLIMYNGSFKTYRLQQPNCSDVLLHSVDSIVCARDLDSRDEEEEEVRMDVFRQMSVGAGVYRGQSIFLTKQACLISVRRTEALLQLNVADSLLKSKVFADFDDKKKTRSGMDVSEDADLLTRFKAAFISSMINNEHNSIPDASLVNELLSPNNNINTNNTTLYSTNNSLFNNTLNTASTQQQQLQLDDIVAKLSRDMIDDYPSLDSPSATTNFTTSVILSNQLEDKVNAHHLLIHFLNKHHLWNKLSWTRDQDGYQATTAVLCQHAEKLAVVAAIKHLYDENSVLLGRAIDRCTRSRHAHASLACSHDHFFRQVSKVHQLLGHLVEEEVSILDQRALFEGGEGVKTVVEVCKVVEVIMDTATAYRSLHSSSYPLPSSNLPSTGRLAHYWTSAGPVVAALLKHHAIIHAQVIPSLGEDSGLREQLFQALFRLTEHILSGMRQYVQALRSYGVQGGRLDEVVVRYEEARTSLIQPFVKQGQTERATSLAETFHHFELLVQLNASDQHKLVSLMHTYQREGFSYVVFNWFCKNGKQHQLLTPPLLEHAELEAFITQPCHRHLSWLYYASTQRNYQAFIILYDLAIEKADNVAEKKNLLSYCKLYGRLSMKTHDVTDKLHDVDVSLELVRRQLLLFQKSSVLQKFGLINAKDAKVYTPKELIQLHIETGYKDEEGLLMAFELIKFLDPEEHEISDVIIDIWTEAILSDDWSGDLHATSPLTSLQHLTTSKLISLLIKQGSVLRAVLPPAASFLGHPPLAHLSALPAFNAKLLVLLEHAQRASID